MGGNNEIAMEDLLLSIKECSETASCRRKWNFAFYYIF